MTLKKNQKRILRLERAKKIGHTLKKLFPHVEMSLVYSTTWELLVAVMLSAQCTDKRVNIVTEKLFKKYTHLNDYIEVSQKTFEKDIYSTGFYKSKAKNIRTAAEKIKNEHNGEVPQTMEELCALPGVARKTANVVLGNAFGIVEGIAVDTHVRRFGRKFDLTDHTTPEKIEQDLMKLFPKKDWFALTYRFIEYGRTICPARKHECAQHPLTQLYPRAGTMWPKASG
jgi:endonuclease-3